LPVFAAGLEVKVTPVDAPRKTVEAADELEVTIATSSFPRVVPHAVLSRIGKALDVSLNFSSRGVWVPAFAGTTVERALTLPRQIPKKPSQFA
jgi:hypothetical protein